MEPMPVLLVASEFMLFLLFKVAVFSFLCAGRPR
jgi:hypothetical protein